MKHHTDYDEHRRALTEATMQTEIERLCAELDKAHRLLSQMIGWQHDAEVAKAKLRAALEQIADIAEGSGTANSLPHIARIARAGDKDA